MYKSPNKFPIKSQNKFSIDFNSYNLFALTESQISNLALAIDVKLKNTDRKDTRASANPNRNGVFLTRRTHVNGMRLGDVHDVRRQISDQPKTNKLQIFYLLLPTVQLT